MLRKHEAHQNNNLSTVVVAALVGGLAGAVVGLMFAPKSGKELAEDLQTFIQESLHMKKSGYIPINIVENTQTEIPLQEE